jgi:hypothetical protein
VDRTAIESDVFARVEARLRAELGMPFAPTVFQLLARHERYLTAAVDALLAGPLRGREIVEDHAARTREIAARAARSLVGEPLPAGGESGSIAALLERYNDANPRSLLLTTPMAGSLTTSVRVMEAPLPEPPGGSGAAALLGDVRACHGDFNVPGLWRELVAGWPLVAQLGWAIVRPLAGEPELGESRRRVLALAHDTVVGLVAPAPAAVGCGAEEARAIERILAWYQLVIPTMTVEIECLRRALELGSAECTRARR